MKKCNPPIVLAIVLLLCFFSIAYAAGEETREAKKIEQKQTVDYLKTWGDRDKFPDSVTFAYYYAYSLSALNEKVTPELKEKIINFIKRCQKKNGGFTSEPKYSNEPNIIFTYYALKSLSFLESLDAIDKEKAKSFVLGLVQANGGFSANNKKGQNPSLAMAFYGVQSLHMLGVLGKLDKPKTIKFINGFISKEGKGFSMMQKGLANPQATNMAVKALDTLGGLTDSNKADVVDYLKTTRYSGLIENKKYKTLPQLKAMADVADALSHLKALGQANTSKMYKFVESLYVAENGGFGPSPGLGTTPPSTYYGIMCLVKLGKLKDPEARGKNKKQ